MDAPTLYRLALGEDLHPDAWQVAFATDAWPRVLIAPTGSGKTAAVTRGDLSRRVSARQASRARTAARCSSEKSVTVTTASSNPMSASRPSRAFASSGPQRRSR